MQIKHFLVVLFSVSAFVLISCSNFDQYTTVGSEIVKDADPDLIDFDGSFLPFSIDSSVTTDMGSVPSGASGTYGRHNNICGVGNKDGISVSAVCNFTISSGTAQKLDTAEIDSIVFIIDTVQILDTIGDSLFQLSPYTIRFDSTAEVSLFLFSGGDDDAPAEEGSQLCTLTHVWTDTTETEFRFTGSILEDAFIESIKEIAEIFSNCLGDSTNAYCDTNTEHSISFSLFTDDSTMYWFPKYPRMLVMSHYVDDSGEEDSTIYFIDTVYCSSRIAAAESEELREENSAKAVSEKLTERTAVFTLDLSSFWDTITSTEFPEILSAAVTFDRDETTFNFDNTIDTMQVRYTLSATYITDETTLSDLLSEDEYYYSAKKTIAGNSNDSLVFPVDYRLQHLLKKKPTELYFYLQIYPVALYRHQEVLWPKPQFKAFLTTLK